MKIVEIVFCFDPFAVAVWLHIGAGLKICWRYQQALLYWGQARKGDQGVIGNDNISGCRIRTWGRKLIKIVNWLINIPRCDFRPGGAIHQTDNSGKLKFRGFCRISTRKKSKYMRETTSGRKLKYSSGMHYMFFVEKCEDSKLFWIFNSLVCGIFRLILLMLFRWVNEGHHHPHDHHYNCQVGGRGGEVGVGEGTSLLARRSSLISTRGPLSRISWPSLLCSYKPVLY